jgi:hypothetical protein
VSDQERLTRGQRQDKALVTATFSVICKELCDYTFARDLGTTLLFGECGTKIIGPIGWYNLSLTGCTGKLAENTGLTQAKVKGGDYDYCKSEFLHVPSVLHQLSGW